MTASLNAWKARYQRECQGTRYLARGPLTRAQRDVLLALRTYRPESGGTELPTVAALADTAECSRSTVHQALRAIKRQGLLP